MALNLFWIFSLDKAKFASIAVAMVNNFNEVKRKIGLKLVWEVSNLHNSNRVSFLLFTKANAQLRYFQVTCYRFKA